MITITGILGFLWGGGALLGFLLRSGTIALTAVTTAVPLLVKVADISLDTFAWTMKALWKSVGVFFEKPVELLPLLVAVFLIGAIYVGSWKPWHIGRASPQAAITSPQKTNPAPAAKRSDDSALGDFICNLSGMCK